MGPQVRDLTASNTDLAASRDRFQALDDADRGTIGDLGSTITQQGATIALQTKDLSDVRGDLAVVTRAQDIWKYVAWTTAGAAVGAMAGRGDLLDTGIGAAAGLVTAFVWKLLTSGL
jgi:hypothetical protein